jgi:hypothetical protein
MAEMKIIIVEDLDFPADDFEMIMKVLGVNAVVIPVVKRK